MGLLIVALGFYSPFMWWMTGECGRGFKNIWLKSKTKEKKTLNVDWSFSRSKSGSSPPRSPYLSPQGRHCSLRPLLFFFLTSQPNLNLTMERHAQCACNPTHGPLWNRAARKHTEYFLFFLFFYSKTHTHCVLVCDGNACCAWMALEAGVSRWLRLHRFTQQDSEAGAELQSNLSFIIVTPPVSAASTWPWNGMTQPPEI